MTKVIVTAMSREEAEKKRVFDWPVWEKEISEFPWEYASPEECFILEGKVEVTDTDSGEVFTVKAGDFVRFERGLKCRWKVLEPIRKHYNFP